ncbi:uncharacterized protein N7459_007403 [Penicillium hispanicum]|uniref:uncharacterized protein n=1 Tax=Penicillium hispanicum TaxID=1080232 RepID=UPI00253FDA51|nr:uncharacterized protein N7459_007403 [Penicillium hispanicum]KAJ5578439.1 hypothetical protein N7459_007403 [Penicillium hispanicum]
MKRFFKGSLSQRSSSSESSPDQHTDGSPETILLQEVATFCESSSNPENQQSGEEFVHLPRIVETAESSPAAAKEAAVRIRKYLAIPARTPNHVQYNAIMLMRILADNPGHTFTRNFDAKFVSTIKDLLRNGRDWHVQHYLRQYLNTLEADRAWDQDLQPLLQMWAKEKTKGERSFTDRWPMGSGSASNTAPAPPPRPGYPPPPPQRNVLPELSELAARIEEGKNSAKLLTQFVQTTPPVEMEDNDLIKEFIDRCRTSSRLIQSYIHATNPAPDEETLLTLIETNDEISVAISQQQRAMLKARKARGSSTPSSHVNSPSPPASAVVASGAARPGPGEPSQGARNPEPSAPLVELSSTVMTGGRQKPSRTNTEQYEYNSADFEVQNPFADDYVANDERHHQNGMSSGAQGDSRVRFQPTEQGR